MQRGAPLRRSADCRMIAVCLRAPSSCWHFLSNLICATFLSDSLDEKQDSAQPFIITQYKIGVHKFLLYSRKESIKNRQTAQVYFFLTCIDVTRSEVIKFSSYFLDIEVVRTHDTIDNACCIQVIGLQFQAGKIPL